MFWSNFPDEAPLLTQLRHRLTGTRAICGC